MADGMSASDRAIKKSAEEEPEYVARPSSKRLTGDEAWAVISRIDGDYPSNYTHVHVFDYPSFHSAFKFYRVNFYYQHDEDPTTRIISFEVPYDQ